MPVQVGGARETFFVAFRTEMCYEIGYCPKSKMHSIEIDTIGISGGYGGKDGQSSRRSPV